MLVDDAAFMRMMIKKALTASGYTDFVEAQDGADGGNGFSVTFLSESVIMAAARESVWAFFAEALEKRKGRKGQG